MWYISQPPMEDYEEHVPYGDRDEWKDVTPIPQDDGDNPVVPIAYAEEFSNAMDYFRAMVAADERSERALKLTQHVVELNAANYTAWHFRRVCLEALGKNAREELDYVTSMAGENPKNYQIWYHRRLMVQKDPSQAPRELKFCEKVFDEDGKNYHAWAHRQWLIENHNLFTGELEFVDKLLLQDLRNNSAWNQRYWVVSKTGDLASDSELVKQEIDWAIDKLQIAVNNESPWNYIMGIVRASKRSLLEFQEVKELCLNLKSQAESASASEDADMAEDGAAPDPDVNKVSATSGFGLQIADCVHVFAMLVRFYREEHNTSGGGADSAALQEACALIEKLATELDIIRRKYWLYQLEQFKTTSTTSATESAAPPAAPSS